MGIAAELFGRELLFLVVTAALGSGLVQLLDDRFDGAARVALAPVLGLCIAVCFYTTAIWFYSGQQLAWTIPLLAGISLGALVVPTVVRRRRTSDRRALPVRTMLIDGVQILVVVLAVALPASTALLRNHSVGPTTYAVYDTVGYVAESDAAQLESLHQAIHAHVPVPNLVESYFTGYSYGYQQLDVAPITASLDGLIGLHATDTQSAFLIALMEIGGLGAFSAIRFALGRRSWFAVLGGALFAGTFFLQLFFDGSQGALSGLTVILPLIAIVTCALRRPRVPNLLLSALVIAGLMTLYPVFVIPVAIAAAIGALVWLVRGCISRRWSFLSEVVRWACRAAAVGIVAVALDVVAARRDDGYWHSLLHGGFVLAGFPQYHLGAGVVASWLLQTRELYTVALGPQSAFNDVVPALLVPLVLVAALTPSIRRQKATWFALLIVAATSLIATFEAAHNQCGYCEDRNLLLAEPALIFVIAVGLAGLFASTNRRVRASAIAVLGVLLGFVAYSLVSEWNRFAYGAYFVTAADRSVISALPPTNRDLEIEGFGEGLSAPGEEPLIYELAFERTHGHVSMPADVNDRQGLAYFGIQPLGTAWFHPGYGYVLTRIPGVATNRQTVAAAPGIALEKPTGSLKVTVDSGLEVPQRPSLDPGGSAWVLGPLRFIVTGDLTHRTYLRLGFALPTASTPLNPIPGAVVEHRGTSVSICVAASAGSEYQLVNLDLEVPDGVLDPPDENAGELPKLFMTPC